MNKEVIDKLVAELRIALARPTMCMLEASVNAAQIFLNGFGTACYAVGITPSLGLRREAVESRGWVSTATGGVDQMQAQGLSEEQIVQELLLIEIKMLELVAEQLEA